MSHILNTVYRDYIACIMCLEFDRLETVIVYVLIKFCSVLFCSVPNASKKGLKKLNFSPIRRNDTNTSHLPKLKFTDGKFR